MKEKKIKLSETAFGSQVESLLKLYGWRYTHFRPAFTNKGYRTPLTGHKGFPDYCAVRGGRLLFIELKSEDGKLSPEQQMWLDDLEEVRLIGAVRVFRPSDFETVMELLK